MLRSMIDRLAIARALAHVRADHVNDDMLVNRWLPVFATDGRRVGEPQALVLDWSRFPEPILTGPAAAGVVDGTLAELSPRYRAVALIDTEGVAPRTWRRVSPSPRTRSCWRFTGSGWPFGSVSPPISGRRGRGDHGRRSANHAARRGGDPRQPPAGVPLSRAIHRPKRPHRLDAAVTNRRGSSGIEDAMLKTIVMILGLAVFTGASVACFGLFSSGDRPAKESCAGLSGQAPTDCEQGKPPR